MATSSIFENIVITDPNVAEAFVRAIEESEKYVQNDYVQPADFKIASHDDIIRLMNMRKQKREAQANGADH